MSTGSPSDKTAIESSKDEGGCAPLSPGGLPPVPRYRDHGLEHPYVVDPELFTKISGLDVPSQVLKLRPIGNRLIVLMNPPVTEWKGLVIPQPKVDVQQGGSGWVVACGPRVGLDLGPYPSGPECHPEDLLYCQVIFSAATGSGIRVQFLDTRTFCQCYTLTARDLWHIDWNPSEYLEREGGDENV